LFADGHELSGDFVADLFGLGFLGLWYGNDEQSVFVFCLVAGIVDLDGQIDGAH
jgi:hypothetical protein